MKRALWWRLWLNDQAAEGSDGGIMERSFNYSSRKNLKRILVLLLSGFCILFVLILSAAALNICRNGLERRAGDAAASVYTREEAVEGVMSALPVFIAGAAVTVMAALTGSGEVDPDSVGGVGEGNLDATGGAGTGSGDGGSVLDGSEAGSAAKSGEEWYYNGMAELKSRHGGKLGRDRFLRGLRTALGLLAVFCIIAGIMNGSMEDVLIKAVTVCAECIGLG